MIRDMNFNSIFEFIQNLNFPPAEHRVRRVYAKQNVAFESRHEEMRQEVRGEVRVSSSVGVGKSARSFAFSVLSKLENGWASGT